MELKRITEERLQALALLPESEWSREESDLVRRNPAYRAEIDAYQLLFEGLSEVEAPEFSLDFEARVMAALPEQDAELSPSKWSVPGWLQWTGLGIGAAGAAAATFLVMPRPSSAPQLPSVDLSAGQSAFQQFGELLQGNALLFTAGVIAIVGTAVLDRVLRKRQINRLGL